MPTAITIDPPTWNDSQSPALSTRVGGTAPAFRAVRGGIYGICFATGEETHTSIQFSHSYIAGSPFRPHVHFTFADTDTPVAGETVIWSMEYSFAAVNAQYSAAATVAFNTYLITAEDVAHKLDPHHRIVGMAEVAAPTFGESGIVKGRIFRSGGTSAVEPCLDSFDIHHQSNKRGTVAEYPA